jgi:adenosylcobinamide-phosphate synthase
VVTSAGARRRIGAVGLALVADRVLGEPPDVAHPVARFGQVMSGLEGRMWADARGRGAAYTAAGVGMAATAGLVLDRRNRLAAVFLFTEIAVAGRGLADAAGRVLSALERDDLLAARRALSALVGRDTTQLDEGEIVRAVVESVAENTVDAVTAPILWALLGGAPAVAAYRAVNTLDAMVGHRSLRYERFGWASARTDDVVNWVPARLTAVAVAVMRPRRAAAVARAVTTQAPAHPSPNAGVVEAAFAAALGVRLGGTNDYGGRIEDRPVLGSGPPPDRATIAEAVKLSRYCAAVVFVAAALAAAATAFLRRGSRT